MRVKNNILLYSSIITLLFVVLTNSCKKEKKDTPARETGTVTDIDGNTYKTIKIGNQWWMAENLKVTKYLDGTTITLLQSDTAKWRKDTTGACCVYDANVSAPGLLYNWYAITNNKKIAPVGWHVPSDEEWKVVERYLGMSASDAEKTSWRGTHEGEKLKIASKQNWTTSGNIWSTNESGFTALPGNCRLFNGIWGDPNNLSSTGFWWSSDAHGNEAWYRYLDYKNANVFRYYGPKTYGLSVRCVKG